MPENTPRRPTVTPEMVTAAAVCVADMANKSEMADDIAKHWRVGIDGFQLGKELDRAGWDITADTVAELDCMGGLVRQLHREACVVWARAHNIQPPHSIGSKITRGVITGVCDHESATYLVKENGCQDPNRSLLIRFEDAELVA